ncbi:MAG: hypothetical protein ACTSPD_00980 [Promethearchaeota archaeon]
MSKKDIKNYCFMARKNLPCVKSKVAQKHLVHYKCEKCIWRIQSNTIKHLNSLEKMFEKYGNKTWN